MKYEMGKQASLLITTGIHRKSWLWPVFSASIRKDDYLTRTFNTPKTELP
jgi:hypothetical protein